MKTTDELQQEIYSFDPDMVISDFELILGTLENYYSECEDQRIHNIISRFSMILNWLRDQQPKHPSYSSVEAEKIRDQLIDFSIQMDTQLQSLYLLLARVAEASGQGVNLAAGLNSVDILWGTTNTIQAMIAECKTKQA